jgi:magnesium transporter
MWGRLTRSVPYSLPRIPVFSTWNKAAPSLVIRTMSPRNPPPGADKYLYEPIIQHMRRDFISLPDALTIGQTLEKLRREGMPHGIQYFYVVDGEGRLVGVLPARVLLAGALETSLRDVMLKRLVFLPDSSTVGDAVELLTMHRLLAVPVVDSEKRVLGIAEVSLAVEGALDLAEQQETDDLFQLAGVRLSALRRAGPWGAFWQRMPWLTATIAGGTLAAIITGLYEETLALALPLAFFLTVTLGLGESVAVQALTITVQGQHTTGRRKRAVWRLLMGEASSALLLGAACGAIVGLIAYLWKGSASVGWILACSLTGSVTMAGIIGVAIPLLLLRLPGTAGRVAAGPLTLTCADLMTLLIYFQVATWILNPVAHAPGG